MTASLCACGSSNSGSEGSTSANGSSAAGKPVAASDILKEADGTENKSKYGANAILGV